MATEVGRRRGRGTDINPARRIAGASDIEDASIERRHLNDGIIDATAVDATIHTQAEAEAHAGLPWSDAHPAPEAPVDMGGQVLNSMGAPVLPDDGARLAETQAVQDNVDTEEVARIAADDAILAQKGAANGIATLDGNAKIPSAQLPALAITSVQVVADIAARDALQVQSGDAAIVTDAGGGLKKAYIYDGAAWHEIDSPDALAAHEVGNFYDEHPGDLPVARGGTGATDAATARANLAVTPANIGAEPAFAKNNAFNKNFGAGAGTVAEGNHAHAVVNGFKVAAGNASGNLDASSQVTLNTGLASIVGFPHPIGTGDSLQYAFEEISRAGGNITLRMMNRATGALPGAAAYDFSWVAFGT